ncbi:MAG: hypothetical protein II100_01205 [Prevotella sp.]|jgi:hypothetical protein|nr:hypothetical protein [Prevotella sp.]MBQ1587986.1 hypothetical protein [Prevotella sp.]MBQ1626109.1 hypothetical protein [Prevotella sp.]MBQ1646270.1 hypothetical protein [Prevotella sp.]MBQ1666411.1 hypothetical protein [Prevotella sp.]
MMKGKNRKKKHVKWLLAMIAIVIALTCIFLFQPFNSPSSHIEGTQEEKEFDALQIKGKWSQIIEKYQERPTSSLACRKVMRLAQIQKGLVGKEAIYECLSDSREVLTSPTAALMMSDVYMQLGMVNMAQRAAFEAMVKTHDIKDNGRALRRLTETALITGQYDLALKYISILEDNPTHRKWARDMRKAVENPDFIEQIPAYQKIKKTYETAEDTFFL